MKTDCEESDKTFESVWKTAPKQASNEQYLKVDDTKRFRASSDPGGLHICIVPEITITGEDGRSTDCAEDDEFDGGFIPPPPRSRANTCPEEMFRNRKERPPTPPPENVHVLRHSTGKRFSFNFSPKDINGLSFALHKLSKVSEDMSEQQHKNTEMQAHESSVSALTKACCFSKGNNQVRVNCSSNIDNEVSRLSSCGAEEQPPTDSSCDTCTSKEMTSVLLAEHNNTSNNNKEHITSINPETVVSSCSPTTCRSKEDSDHLIAC